MNIKKIASVIPPASVVLALEIAGAIFIIVAVVLIPMQTSTGSVPPKEVAHLFLQLFWSACAAMMIADFLLHTFERPYEGPLFLAAGCMLGACSVATGIARLLL